MVVIDHVEKIAKPVIIVKTPEKVESAKEKDEAKKGRKAKEEE